MTFSRLRERRESRGLTQQQVAEMLDVHQTVYSRYERGTQTVPIAHLLTLAAFYQTSVDYLLGRTSDPIPYEEPPTR